MGLTEDMLDERGVAAFTGISPTSQQNSPYGGLNGVIGHIAEARVMNGAGLQGFVSSSTLGEIDAEDHADASLLKSLRARDLDTRVAADPTVGTVEVCWESMRQRPAAAGGHPSATEWEREVADPSWAIRFEEGTQNLRDQRVELERINEVSAWFEEVRMHVAAENPPELDVPLACLGGIQGSPSTPQTIPPTPMIRCLDILRRGEAILVGHGEEPCLVRLRCRP